MNWLQKERRRSFYRIGSFTDHHLSLYKPNAPNQPSSHLNKIFSLTLSLYIFFSLTDINKI